MSDKNRHADCLALTTLRLLLANRLSRGRVEALMPMILGGLRQWGIAQRSLPYQQ